uniref:Cytochrome c oxidase assembly factor 3 n=1 Tax=Myripristis murdjan TaxID=586833 RepID=A0A667WJ38_9TELE
MAEKEAAGGAQTAAEKQLPRRRQELDYWKQNAERLRRRNRLTGLAIGAFVLGMFGYTILSVRQEKIMKRSTTRRGSTSSEGRAPGPTPRAAEGAGLHC